jgi:porphobilinogen synthase
MSAFPATRLRRLRRSDRLRSLVRETRLDLEDFVFPLFVGPATEPNPDLPAMGRHSVEDLVAEAEEAAKLGVCALLLFGIPEEKDEDGSGAWDEDGIVQRALRALRRSNPELVLMTDVCLCEYTSHGHCGVLEGEEVDNDATLELLARTSVSHAAAGADAVCPSDMMDGRVAAIRLALDEDGHGETPIVSYAAKYASAFYGPFRDAVQSSLQGDRRTYQQDAANIVESLREIDLDIAEGADMVMVKPAMSYLDVVAAAAERSSVPVAAYQVSGEYSMIQAAAANGWIDLRTAAIESLTSIRRAGARIVLTYFALDVPEWTA